MKAHRFLLSTIPFSLTLLTAMACQDSKKKSQSRPEAPRVLAGSGGQASPKPAGVPLKPAPLPPLPPSSPNNPAPSGPQLDAAAQEFLRNAQGRWRTSCVENEEGKSLFYGVEFKDQVWSTLFFEYSENDACIHMAAPNEGLPRTYELLSLTKEEESEEGWFSLKGRCLSSANSCSGEQAVRVRFDEAGILRLRVVSGASLWVDPLLSEMVYDF